MYCVNCGVKLAETEKKCPLCNTEVCHPSFSQRSDATLYPKNKMPKAHAGTKALSGAIIILFLIPVAVCFFADLQKNGGLDWFGFALGALAVLYVWLPLPFWFRNPNPVIFVPCGFAAVALYLLYVNAVTNGDWFLTFALPVTAGICLITTSVIALLRYLKKGRLYIFGGMLIAISALILLIEHLMSITFKIAFIGWSVYPLIVLMLFGGLLIYLAINRSARELLERKLFF